MIDSLINFLENGSLEILSRFFILYLLVLWVLFPVWVYLDAKKRYQSSYLATLFFIFILPFNLPGFIFYLIIRPEHPDDRNHAVHHEGAFEGAVNIPVANFINESGIVMSLNLSINHSVLKQDQDIKMNVHFDANPDKIQMQTMQTSDLSVPSVTKKSTDVGPGSSESILEKIKTKLSENVGVVLNVIKNTDLEEKKGDTSVGDQENKADQVKQFDIK